MSWPHLPIRNMPVPSFPTEKHCNPLKNSSTQLEYLDLGFIMAGNIKISTIKRYCNKEDIENKDRLGIVKCRSCSHIEDLDLIKYFNNYIFLFRCSNCNSVDITVTYITFDKVNDMSIIENNYKWIETTNMHEEIKED